MADLGADPPANTLVIDVIAVEQCDKGIDIQQGASHRFLVTQPVDESIRHRWPPMLERFEAVDVLRLQLFVPTRSARTRSVTGSARRGRPAKANRCASVRISADPGPASASSMIRWASSLSLPTPATVAHRAWCCQDGWVDHLESTEISDVTDALGLWRRLVSGAVGRALPPAVAVDTFRRIHRGGESGAFDSALLLCTDWRWRRVSAQVLAGILELGILDDDDQDRLADTLLWQQRVRYRHPIWWIGTSFIEYHLGAPEAGRRIRVDPNTPATADRSVWPPLRTWAVLCA